MSTERARRTKPEDGLLIVGLVGRAGSGKSTVARTFVEQSARLIAADEIGHEVTDRDPVVRRALELEYGPDVYRPEGALDRRRVAERVFSDPQARERLDRLVHPRIIAEIHARLGRLRAARFRGVVVVDAALMLDWGLERECDVVLAVAAAEADQLARLMRSRGWSEAESRARLAVQRTNDAFRAAADETLENSGSEADLRERVLALLRRWAAGGKLG